VHPLRWMGMDMVRVMGDCVASGGVKGMIGSSCSGSVAKGVGVVGGIMVGVMKVHHRNTKWFHGWVGYWQPRPEQRAVMEVEVVGEAVVELEVAESEEDESVDAWVVACHGRRVFVEG
ncbi:hypothetical protein Taro_054503, partial [Colocasia esculenta]|nr:hypothetical protein [Colocasia esculenta]